MARIKSYGAHEVGRRSVGTGNLERIYVMCSDGRVLSRYVDPPTDYTLVCRGIGTWDRSQAGLDKFLAAIAKAVQRWLSSL